MGSNGAFKLINLCVFIAAILLKAPGHIFYFNIQWSAVYWKELFKRIEKNDIVFEMAVFYNKIVWFCAFTLYDCLKYQ